jgi:hypothetical protein
VFSLFHSDLNFAFAEDLYKKGKACVRRGLELARRGRDQDDDDGMTCTSRAIAFLSSEPKDFLRSFDLATSPFETFKKTLEIWRTSSRSFSLQENSGGNAVPVRFGCTTMTVSKTGAHFISPLLDFVFITCDLFCR